MSLRLGLDGTPLLGLRSGVGQYTGRLLAALLQAYPDWSCLLYTNRPLAPLEEALARAQPVLAHFPRSRWLWMQFVLPGVIRQSGVDLCHFTNAQAPLLPGAPFVLTIHDASLFLYSQYHPRTRLLAMRSLLPALSRRAAAIITVSQQARQELARVLNIPPAKIFVVHEAAPDHFHPVVDPQRQAALRHKYHLPPRFLLHVGTLEPRKNLDRLVRALTQVRRQGYPHPLILAGPTGWHMEHFMAKVAACGMADRVRYLGYVPTADLPALFSCADLFVYPSLYEGFGLPLVEAMACGAPVLTSNLPTIVEVCADAACLVDPYDEAALAAAISDLLADAGRRRELRQRGLARAADFSWRRAARETALVYRRVLPSPVLCLPEQDLSPPQPTA